MPITDYFTQVAYPLRQPFLDFNKLYLVVSLPFNMQAQTQSNWCWAATSTSVSLFYRSNSGWTQCKVANGELGLGTCCNSPVPGACNVAWYLDRALTRTGNFVSYSGPMSFADVQSELRAGRVVGARIGWSGGGGHFMVIYGAITVGTDQFFQIDDPIYGKSQLTVSAFSSNYQGSGSWTHAYKTRRPFPVLKFIPLAIPDRWLEMLSKYQPPHSPTPPGVPEQRPEVGLALPHQAYVLGLDAVLGNSIEEARPTFVRAFQLTGEDLSGFVDFDERGSGQIMQMAGPENAYASNFQRALEAAEGHEALSGAEVEPRLVRIPALYTDILWLKGDSEGDGIVISSPQDIPVGQVMPIREILERLRPAAEQLKGSDDDMIGS